PAPEAVAAGLIADTYPDEGYADAIEALAQRIADGPSDAFGSTKAAINDATLTELDAAFARERAGQLVLLAADDFREGATAFMEKRPAVYRKR
ncbi:enoyl-CoA hydratase-related protein, partial [Rhodococcus sp. CX]|uniref:enoyl-CoA hydratase-related protein n=2 Tax=unclassified Rhodococcus (in: high G+C Gram-positive bacteria) TaxID=192944 RepID=UPI001E407CB1